MLVNDTINANTAATSGGGGGGVLVATASRLLVLDTIIFGNTGGLFPNVWTVPGVSVTDQGGNLVGLGVFQGNFGFGPGTLTSDPKLGPLQNNGGPLAGAPGAQQAVLTEALSSGSVAVNAGVGGGPGSDERGETRDGRPDIGAYELGGVPPTVSIGTLHPSVQTRAVASITITFSERVLGLNLADLQLLCGGVNLLSAAQTLTSSDGITWVLGNLAGLTDPTHRLAAFRLVLSPTGITDAAGHPLAAGATLSFTEADPVLASGLSGQTLTVTGTSGNDTFSFTAGKVEQVSLNGVSYTIDSSVVTAIAFVGNGGHDSVTLSAGSGATATLTPTGGELQGTGYTVSVSGVSTIVALGGAGDIAYLYGSAGNDTCSATPTLAFLAGTGFTEQASGFAVTAAISMGGHDTAYLYDSPGNDTFVANPSYAALTGTGFDNQVFGFAVVDGIASAGGNDTAFLYGSAGHDTFSGTPAASYFVGSGFQLQATGFRTVNAISNSATATAYLYDGPGDDTFVGTGTIAQLSGPGYTLNLQNFADVVALAVNGGSNRKYVNAIDYVFTALGNWM
jgi:hypothetical protein